MSSINPTELDLNEETVVKINRVAKVVAGGRRFRFSAIVAIGDGQGHVGLGHGKANEVISAISKSKENAKKSMFRVPIINGTIPHKIVGKFGAAKVMLHRASRNHGHPDEAVRFIQREQHSEGCGGGVAVASRSRICGESPRYHHWRGVQLGVMMAKKSAKSIHITQIKSAIGHNVKAKKTLEALGLRRMNQTVVHADTPVIRGMVNRVSFLLKVEDAS